MLLSYKKNNLSIVYKSIHEIFTELVGLFLIWNYFYWYEFFFGKQEYCPTIKNILLLDSEGKRVAVRYYTDDWPTHSAKIAFEKSTFTKTQKSNARTEGNFDILFFHFHILIFAECGMSLFFISLSINYNTSKY